jgi:hypothetical protein
MKTEQELFSMSLEKWLEEKAFPPGLEKSIDRYIDTGGFIDESFELHESILIDAFKTIFHQTLHYNFNEIKFGLRKCKSSAAQILLLAFSIIGREVAQEVHYVVNKTNISKSYIREGLDTLKIEPQASLEGKTVDFLVTFESIEYIEHAVSAVVICCDDSYSLKEAPVFRDQAGEKYEVFCYSCDSIVRDPFKYANQVISFLATKISNKFKNEVLVLVNSERLNKQVN